MDKFPWPGLRLLVMLLLLLLALENDIEGDAMIVQAPPFLQSSRRHLMTGNFFNPPAARSYVPSSRLIGYAGVSAPSLHGNDPPYNMAAATPGNTAAALTLGVYSGQTTSGSQPRPGFLGRSSRHSSAFRNLFGTDITESAGIFNSFGKAKRENLAHSPSRDGAAASRSLDSYRSYPFSSLRLTPVSHVSGVSGRSPGGGSPIAARDEDVENRRDRFGTNRALQYRHKDPFEKPISRSSFPLPGVNSPITLDLAQDQQARVNYARNNRKLPPLRTLTDVGKEEDVGKFLQGEAVEVRPSAPVSVQSGWEKPPAVPGLPQAKLQTVKQNVRASQAKMPPGRNTLSAAGSASFLDEAPGSRPGSELLEPRRREESPNEDANLTKNKARHEESSLSRMENALILSPEHSTTDPQQSQASGEVTALEVPSPVPRLASSTEAKLDGNDSVTKAIFPKGQSSSSISNSDNNNSNNIKDVAAGDTERSEDVNSHYDYTVLTDERITKKSGTKAMDQLGLGKGVTEVPATKRVVERTIDSGKQKIKTNEIQLPTDNVGFIITDALHDNSHGQGTGQVVGSKQSGRSQVYRNGINPVLTGSHSPDKGNAAVEDDDDKNQEEFILKRAAGADNSPSSSSDAVAVPPPPSLFPHGNQRADDAIPEVGSGYLLHSFNFDPNHVPPPPSLRPPLSEKRLISSSQDNVAAEFTPLRGTGDDRRDASTEVDGGLRIGIQQRDDWAGPGDGGRESLHPGHSVDSREPLKPELVNTFQEDRGRELEGYTESADVEDLKDEEGKPSDNDFHKTGHEFPRNNDDDNNNKNEFLINTDPSTLNFDLLKAGAGHINVRRTSEAFKPESETIRYLSEEQTPGVSAEGGDTQNDDVTAEKVSDDARTGGGNPAHNNGAEAGDSTPAQKHGPEESLYPKYSSSLKEDHSDLPVEETQLAETSDSFPPSLSQRASPDYYGQAPVDYEYDDDYDYRDTESKEYLPARQYKLRDPSAAPSPPRSPSSTSSSFLSSPFQSMFGKSLDQAEQGDFGSLFDNLHTGVLGGANSGFGRSLFDERLGEIVEKRPSLGLFGKKKR